MKIFDSFLDCWDRENSPFRALFFDIDGTLINGGEALPGAKQLIEKLKEENFPFLLLTNDGNHSVEEKSAFLYKAGLKIPSSNFISCGMAIKIFVEKNNCSGKKFFVMGDLGKPCYAELASLKVERDPKKISECAGVIVGEGIYDWQRAFFAVVNFFIYSPSAPLLVPNPDSYWPFGKDGRIGIGAGGKARFICTLLKEYGINKHPVYFGKPYRMIFDYAMQQLKILYPETAKIKRGEILMLGDSLRSDIKGANSYGIISGLLLTGITKEDHLKNLKKCMRPDFVYRHL